MSDPVSVAAFVDELAADPPGPAAGSAAAVTVAMAAALVELVARRAGAEDAAAQARALRARALPLADADARAYGDVLEARGEARRAALERSSDVLRDIASTAAEVGALASPLGKRTKPALRGDVRAAIELADAARRVADDLVLVNRADASRGGRASDE